MRERPILFSADMVRALLDGAKTQTRRVIKPQPDRFFFTESEPSVKRMTWKGCKYRPAVAASPYQVGMRLWVRETHAWLDRHIDGVEREDPVLVGYPSDDSVWRFEPDGLPLEFEKFSNFGNVKLRPSIFLPRWASRITLEIVSVRVERVNEITPHDACAEGVHIYAADKVPDKTDVAAFRELWDSLNAKRGFGWETNPFVWAIEFRRTTSGDSAQAGRVPAGKPGQTH